MPPFILYLLKVIVCSAILYGYYKLVLQNKLFHQWNRFYLLAAVLISISFPLVRINIEQTAANNETMQVIRLLQVVDTDTQPDHEGNSVASTVSYEQVISIGYITISILIITLLLHALFKIWQLIQQSTSRKVEGINIIDTEAKGTPFSFFRYIFWNRKIDMDSDTGRKIFRHELVHVRENHSVDRVLMNIVLIPFWSNPFFWLIRREMTVIHEFIADSKAVEDNDTASFAAMIIHAAYPQHSFEMTSTFFSSSIKRRLHMLTNMNNRKVNYLGRIMALPLLAFIFIAFTIKTKHSSHDDLITTAIESKITVVIDAGHGGQEPGAQSNRVYEKDLTLALAKKVKALNNNPAINILLTRETDIYQPVREKVTWTMQQQPDAFISLHVAADPDSDKSSGFELYISRQSGPYEAETRVLASLVSDEISSSYTVFPQLKQRLEKGIWVLDAPEINYPAILIECGYLTNKKDLAFIRDNTNQEKIARNVLNAIEKYAKARAEANSGNPNIPDAPFYASPDNAGDDFEHRQQGRSGTTDKQEADTIPAAKKVPAVAPPKDPFLSKGVDPKVADIYINGMKSDFEAFCKVPQESIVRMNVVKDATAVNGLIEIITEKYMQEDDKVFVRTEVEASFPGGEESWKKYAQKVLDKNKDALEKEGKKGTCIVEFIVDKNGYISNITALTMKGTALAGIAVDAVKKGPQWNPALQNGRLVKAYRRQPVSYGL